MKFFPVIEITNDVKPPDIPPADFEKAISASGHGLFHYLLLLAGLPCCAATLYETSTMSYVLPSADCDLHLTLTDKGVLNAVTYAGNSRMDQHKYEFIWSNISVTLRYDNISHSLGIFIRQTGETKAPNLWIFTRFGLRVYVRYESKCLDTHLFQIYGRIHVIYLVYNFERNYLQHFRLVCVDRSRLSCRTYQNFMEQIIGLA